MNVFFTKCEVSGSWGLSPVRLLGSKDYNPKILANKIPMDSKINFANKLTLLVFFILPILFRWTIALVQTLFRLVFAFLFCFKWSFWQILSIIDFKLVKIQVIFIIIQIVVACAVCKISDGVVHAPVNCTAHSTNI